MPAAPSCPITLPTDTEPLHPDDLLTASPGLLDMLRQVPDPRARRGVRHNFFPVLTLSVMAVLTGARGYTAIWRWSSQALPEALQALNCPPGAVASESTFRRILQAIDPDELMLLVATWLAAHLDRLAKLQERHQARMRAATQLSQDSHASTLSKSTACVIAVDGKTVRGSRDRDRLGTHLLAAVLGQQVVDTKTNEITHLPTLLASLNERGLLPEGAVVTADALHTQRDTAQAITDLGLDYAFTVKRNQPKLHDHLAALPWDRIPTAHSEVDRGHGRIEERHTAITEIAAALGGLLQFPGARTALRIVRRRRESHQQPLQDSIEVVYVITSISLDRYHPDVLAGVIRRHWAVENKLHYVRDTAFDEDRPPQAGGAPSRARTGHGAAVLASLRNLVITALRLLGCDNIRAALEHHSYDRNRPLRTLQRLT